MRKIEKFDQSVAVAVNELFSPTSSAEPVTFTEIMGILEAHKLCVFGMMQQAKMIQATKDKPLIMPPNGLPKFPPRG